MKFEVFDIEIEMLDRQLGIQYWSSKKKVRTRNIHLGVSLYFT